jgi:protein-glutamine gamma-glutamyltransferase
MGTSERGLRFATYLLVVDGVVALGLARVVSPAGALLVAGALALTASARVRALASAPVTAVLFASLTALGVVDLLYFAASTLDGFGHLLLGLILLRLLTARRPRDVRDAGLLSFFVLVAGSAFEVSFGFLFVFIAYLLGVTWMLLLYHLAAEGPPARRTPAFPRRAELGWIVAVASSGTVVVTAAFFVIIPRVGEATVAFGHQLRRMTTGFSERVELGAIGQIERDPTVAMRVYLPGGEPPTSLSTALRWRGLALDHYDGVGWTASRGRRMTMRPAWTGEVNIAPRKGAGPVLRQDVVLEPIGTGALFVAPGAFRVTLPPRAVTVDDLGSLLVPPPTARLSYTVESDLAAGLGARPPATLDAATRARHLQLPPLPPRIGELARRITGGIGDPYDAASAVTTYLATHLRYSLTLDRTPGFDPLDEFLFARRSGNCEYFASALAVMLRSIGIPARVVTGFQRGEWNPYGNYFVLRMADAHAWVEAHIAGSGWITLDPSPRGETAPGSNTLSLYVDAMRMRWYRYVVSWSRQDQVEVAARLRDWTWTRRSWSVPGPPWTDLGRVALPLSLLGALAVLGLAWRHGRRGAPAGAASIPDFYRRGLAALARRGFTPRPAETAREFRERVSAASPEVTRAMRDLTAAYEHVRFGAGALAASDAAELAAAVRRLTTRDFRV